MSVGLYIHVPFCKRKCPYCDFYSVAGREDLMYAYARAVVRNIEKYKGNSVNTIYFGGGTPSLIPIECYEIIFDAIKRYLSVTSDAEISLEVNPCTVDEEKLKRLKNIGFNRISIGVQSLDNNELLKLGRLHNSQLALNTIKSAKNVGFKNISCDVMLGIIGQNKNSLKKTLDILSEFGINHISAYMLIIEPDTKYDCEDIIKQLPDEDTVADLYLFAVDKLNAMGFEQYEISNFAQNTFECKHNLKYWRCEEYIGIGPSAHSYFINKRYFVKNDLKEFISQDTQTEIINEENPHTFEEFAMLRLRLSEGLKFKDIESFGINPQSIAEKAYKYQKAGMVDICNETIKINKNGFLVSNDIIADLVI